MSIIIGPDAAFVTQAIEEIIEITGRTVTLEYITSSGPCPVCSGLDSFCSTCNGNPSLEVLGTLDVTATVKWKVSNLPESKRYRPEGQYLDGDCLLTIAYDPLILPILDKTRKVDVDGRACVIKGYYFRGQMALNRIYISLLEDERIDGSFRS